MSSVDLQIWLPAALTAGALGWVGPQVIRRLPESPDAETEAPTYATIAAVPRLGLWLAGGAIVLVTIVSLAVRPHVLPAWTLACGVGSWLFYIDWRTRLLPTRIVVPLTAAMLLVIALQAVLVGDWAIFFRAVVAGVAACGVFWLFWWVAQLRRPGGFGFGDVRFAAPLGVVLGSVGAWTAAVGLYFGILIGGVVGLVFKARGHDEGFALGPWMLLGAVLAPAAMSMR